MKKLDLLAAALLIVGGLNWGLVAVAEFDLVAWIFGLEFGETNAASRIVLRPGRPRGRLRNRARWSAVHAPRAQRPSAPTNRLKGRST